MSNDTPEHSPMSEEEWAEFQRDQDEIADMILAEDGYGKRTMDQFFSTPPSDRDLLRALPTMKDAQLDRLQAALQANPTPLNIVQDALIDVEREKRSERGGRSNT